MKFFISLLIFLLTVNIAEAAVVHGTVYDLSLKVVNNAIVEINTQPNQRLVAKDGSYSFSVPEGTYKISAFYKSSSEKYTAEETLTIKEDGNYVFDLFLFPVLEDEELVDEELNIDTELMNDKISSAYIIGAVILFLIILAVYILYRKKNKAIVEFKHEEEPVHEEKIEAEEIHNSDDLDKLIEFIKKNDGRVTQKDIRKEFPLSEAKISIMLTALEHNGIVKRIKKGRGNVVVLVKN